MLAIIGGSGFTEFTNLADPRREAVGTPFGPPSAPLVHGQLAGRDVVFLARHGVGHVLPPHRINYRANLWALKEAGAAAVVAIAAVGSIAPFAPGALVLPHQLIDYTCGREASFFDGHDGRVVHVDFTQPYATALREQCLAAALAGGVTLHDGGIYGVTQGPRLETAAEVDRLERDGCTLVGMTGMPEAVLARELELPYATIAVVVNHAAGRGDSAKEISFAAIEAVLATAMHQVRKLLASLAPLVP